MGDPMKIRAKANGDEVEVKVLMAHEMETGQRKDSDGNTIAAWFIQEVVGKCNDRVVLQAYWGPAVAKNPFLSFSFKGGKAGDTIQISWTDNKGDTRTDKTTVS